MVTITIQLSEETLRFLWSILYKAVLGIQKELQQNSELTAGKQIPPASSKIALKKKVYQLAREGKPARQIIEETRVPKSTVYRWLEEGGFSKKQKKEELKLKAYQLVRSGKPITKIAKEIGVSRSTVHRWLKKMNFEKENGTPPPEPNLCRSSCSS